MLKTVLKYIDLFFTGAFSYGIIELIFRGYTHISMGILGGVCYILIGSINKVFGFDFPLALQMFISAVIITVLEFTTGIIVNVWLHLDIWDYSKLPLNIMGQICLPFFFIWFFLSVIGIFLDDYERYFLFNEEKPHYCIFKLHYKIKKPL